MKIANIIFVSSKIHPTFFITISFICGILLQSVPYALTASAITSSIALISLAIFKKNRKKIKISLLLLLAFTLGAFRYNQKINAQKTFYHKTANSLFDVIATIKDIYKTEEKIRHTCITAYVEKIKSTKKDEWEAIYKTIQIYTKKNNGIEIEDKIKIKNIKLKKPKTDSFSLHLLKQNIAATIFTPQLEHEIILRPKQSILRWLKNKRKKIAKNLKGKMPPKLFSMFSSIFLGNRNTPQKYNHEIKNKFKSFGILHFLARSGLHLIIFLLLCNLMLTFFPLCFYKKQIIIIILSSTYLLLSWPSISFTRAFSILILYKLYPFFNKKPDITHIVTIVCFSMLLCNPVLLFFLDFQLSFALTFSLAMFSQIQIQRARKIKLTTKKIQKKPFPHKTINIKNKSID